MLVSGSKKGSRTPLLVSSSCRDSGSSRCFCMDGWEVVMSYVRSGAGRQGPRVRAPSQTNQWAPHLTVGKQARGHSASQVAGRAGAKPPG